MFLTASENEELFCALLHVPFTSFEWREGIFGADRKVVQGKLGQAGWKQRGQSTLIPAWARALREPGACSNSSQRATVAALKIREWLRSSFWGAAPISTWLAEIFSVISYLYTEREFCSSQVDKLGSSQHRAWWPQRLLSNEALKIEF